MRRVEFVLCQDWRGVPALAQLLVPHGAQLIKEVHGMVLAAVFLGGEQADVIAVCGDAVVCTEAD
jgi:hypothetical protein